MGHYILIDLLNFFHRARHVIRAESAEERAAMAVHITISSINKMWNMFDGKHLVFCGEGRSWRKNFDNRYKANRTAARQALTRTEIKEEELFYEAINRFTEFVANKTNATYLQHSELEADDLIAGWIESHPDDEHIIFSSDKDFQQLLAKNVKIFNGINNYLYSLGDVVDLSSKTPKQVIDKKTGKPMQILSPELLLFEKCVRGDPGDNVMSAMPGARKTKIIKAYEDRKRKGFDWNNFMLQEWTDHNGEKKRVLDEYNKNVILIDLKAQPDDIKAKIVETINKAKNDAKAIPMVGVNVIRYLHQNDLVMLEKRVDDIAPMFAARI